MAQYILLLRSESDYWGKMTPEDLQTWMQRYMDWGKKPGVSLGKRLEPFTGRVMEKAAGKVRVTDGPYGEAREVIGGYYFVEAKSFDEAVAMSMDHPHVEHGIVEVREVAPVYPVND